MNILGLISQLIGIETLRLTSFAVDGTKGVDLPSFPAFVFLEGATVDLAGSSIGAVVDSLAADGTKRGDLPFFSAFVFLE